MIFIFEVAKKFIGNVIKFTLQRYGDSANCAIPKSWAFYNGRSIDGSKSG